MKTLRVKKNEINSIPEKWKYIEGFNKWYSVSNTGKVRSNRRKRYMTKGKKSWRQGKQRIIKPKTCNTSARVGLYLPDGNREYLIVKDLVAKHHINLWYPGCKVRLKDFRDKTNCHESNIIIVGVNRRGGRKLTWEQVEEIRKFWEENPIHGKKTELAKKYNVSVDAISKVINRERRQYEVKSENRRRNVSVKRVQRRKIHKTNKQDIPLVNSGKENSLHPDHSNHRNPRVAECDQPSN